MTVQSFKKIGRYFLQCDCILVKEMGTQELLDIFLVLFLVILEMKILFIEQEGLDLPL